MLDALLERNLLPDGVIRFGIRRLLHDRLRSERSLAGVNPAARVAAYVDDLRSRPIAEQTVAANEQHYEVPAEFYQYCLGRRLKYSSAFFPTGDETLDQAEEAMLELYIERAEIVDGQTILEMGCGWGSLSLFLAERFPRSRITAVSNSHSQGEFILARARERGLVNLEIRTADMNLFEAESAMYDRVISIEMFEHMKNYERLLAKVARWLKPDGKLFVHIFTHREYAYHFVADGPSDWMARYFFTGGQMPSHELLGSFQDDLTLVRDWKIPGRHYQRTAECWLDNMDAHRPEIEEIFRKIYGEQNAKKWWAYWRIFFMSCAELWGFRDGSEWIVSHYLFTASGRRTKH
ncbi:MAG TPA: cyclopropane-fatty-acyl-phospholipid synthase family protein [Opitutaceae bacterium]